MKRQNGCGSDEVFITADVGARGAVESRSRTRDTMWIWTTEKLAWKPRKGLHVFLAAYASATRSIVVAKKRNGEENARRRRHEV